MQIIDADSHIFENLGEIVEYLEPPYNIPAMLRVSPWPNFDGFNRTFIGVNLQLEHEGIAINPQTWLEHMDRSGTDKVILFPGLGLTTGALQDPEWVVMLCKAYNSWFSGTYHHADPERMFGVALLPIQDPVEAAKELRRCVTELGTPGGMLVARSMTQAPLGDTIFDPIYEEAQRLDCPLVVHGGYFPGLGYDHWSTFAPTHSLGHPISQMLALSSIVMGGVLDRFPTLRLGFFEAGCGWIPYMMERMDEDHCLLKNADEVTWPSDQIKSGRVYVTTELSPNLPHAIQSMGEDCIMFSVDFPHENDTPKARHMIDEIKSSTEYTDAFKNKLLNENAKRFYGL